MENLVDELKRLLEQGIIDDKKNLNKMFPEEVWGSDCIVKMNEGGQRVRGMLVLLSYYISCKGYMEKGKTLEDIVEPALPLAVALEFIQTAVLVQDDIIDGAAERRKQESIHRAFIDNNESPFYQKEREGNGASYLLAAALLFHGLCMILENKKYDGTVKEETYKMLCDTIRGEAVDVFAPLDDRLRNFNNFERGEMALGIALEKTAIYSVAFPLSAGFMLAGAEPDVVERMRDIGEKLGLVYQLDNDLREIMEMKSGKACSIDLIRYRITYANAIAMENEELKEKIWKCEKKEEDIKPIINEYPFDEVKKKVLEKREEYVNSAMKELTEANFLDEEGKNILSDYITKKIIEDKENG